MAKTARYTRASWMWGDETFYTTNVRKGLLTQLNMVVQGGKGSRFNRVDTIAFNRNLGSWSIVHCVVTKAHALAIITRY
jgi:hypothetical protein